MEWIHEGLPPPNSCAEVWLGGSSVRKVQRDCMGDLQFTDCTHPLSNICCAKQDVMAWRPVEGKPYHYLAASDETFWRAMFGPLF